jgi:hypothetical protein
MPLSNRNGRRRSQSVDRRVALAFGLDRIVVDRSRPTDPARSVFGSNTAITCGKPAITVESSSLGCTDACIDQIADGVHSMMRELGYPMGHRRSNARCFSTQWRCC